MTPRRIFLPWDRPLPPQAAAWLAGEWAGDGPLDLSRVLIVVPTRQSGRRLREALAAHAAGRGQAVFAPRVVTPETMVADLVGPDTASRLESLLAWAGVLRGAAAGEAREVFPAGVPVADDAAALRLAGEFLNLQSQLAEGGLRLADVASRAKAEPGRWRQLAALEEEYDRALAARGRRDAQAAKIIAGHAGIEAGRFGRVILLATPDPLPLALTALRNHPAVEVVVFAPETEAAAFDEWGRPLADSWRQREPALPDFARRVQLCADASAQAERVAALARAYGEPDGLLAVGAADPALPPLLEGALEREGVKAFNPEGRPRRQEGLHHLLSTLAALARADEFTAVEALARCPDVLVWLSARLGDGFSATGFLAELDRLRARHLPGTLEEARRHSVAPALGLVAELRAMLLVDQFPRNAAAALAEIFAARRAAPGPETEERWRDSAEAWAELMRGCAEARVKFPGLDEAAWWDLALRTFGEERQSGDKPAGALELQGWLELLFEDAPHLVVAGCNDGRVPEAVAGDVFLPEALRVQLGLKSNEARFARDAYLLQALAASRPRLDLLYGKYSEQGEALRPSRLLLRCADAELPARVALLFREPPPPAANPPWRRAWKLAPPRGAAGGRIGVTALKAWLACPFRFYLRHGLKMEPVDPAKDEMDAFDFGRLCHGALEAMGREQALRDCVDAEALEKFLLGALEREAEARYGRQPALPLIVQLESARQRLARAAAVQARERAAGWVTVEVERPFEIALGGLTVSGRIDRIDRHAETGAVRVLDYKTSDNPVSPREAHLRSISKHETPPPWLAAVVDGKAQAWADLQLPLYRHALEAGYGPAVVAAYFNLPKAVGGTSVAPWDGLTPELQGSARGAAEAVCAAIAAGEFWPPAELKGREAERDDFAPLFQRGAADSVAWEGAAP
jgi:ATP-dependent helicase/nuclease subunit B